jgi:hypothetical protein
LKDKKHVTVGKIVSVGLLAFAASTNVTTAQVPEGRIYALHSKAEGACPSLDWHIVVEPNGVLAGMIAWDDMKTMARATGRINQENRTFSMIAKEIGGQTRTATIDGQIEDNGWITAKIKGPQGTCNALVVPIFAVPPGTK